LMSN